MRPSLLLFFLAACGGASVPEPSSEPAGGTPSRDEPSKPAQPGSGERGGEGTADCANPEAVLVESGAAIARPSGSALRLELVYQGSTIGVRKVRGVDMVLAPSDGPFSPGANAGYWADVLDGGGAPLYTRLLRDPTRLEAPASPGGGDFRNVGVPRCEAKTILLDVPNAASAATIVVYGSPYGTADGAVEIGRFTLK